MNMLGKKTCSPPLYYHECKSVCTSLSSLKNHDLANRCWVWLFSRFTSTTRHNTIFITSIIKHLWFIFFVSGSVSVPSVTVVAVASWVRGICKYSASHLSLKHSSATRTAEARRAIAVMVIRPLSQKCLERPPQDREKRQGKSDTQTIWKCWSDVTARILVHKPNRMGVFFLLCPLCLSLLASHISTLDSQVA